MYVDQDTDNDFDDDNNNKVRITDREYNTHLQISQVLYASSFQDAGVSKIKKKSKRSHDVVSIYTSCCLHGISNFCAETSCYFTFVSQ